MKKINILLAVSILGGSLFSLKNNSVPSKQKLMSTRSVNIDTYTTKEINDTKYEITISLDSQKYFSNKVLIKLSSGETINTGMTSITINQNISLPQNHDYLLADCQKNGSIAGNEISRREFTAIEYMCGLLKEEDIEDSLAVTKKATTFSSSDFYMHSERLTEGVSYYHNYSFPANFVNGSTYAYDGLIGSGYYITVVSVKKTYNIFGGIKSSKTSTYKIYYIETSSIKMVTREGKVL